MVQSDGNDILVSTLQGKMWHLPSPMRGYTLCGFAISTVPLKAGTPYCRKCVRAEIRRLRSIYADPGMTAGEFVERLPMHFRTQYWRDKITEYCEREGIDPDA